MDGQEGLSYKSGSTSLGKPVEGHTVNIYGTELHPLQETRLYHPVLCSFGKQIDGVAAPFVYLGTTSQLLSYEGNRPIRMVWELEYPMPAALFEEARPS